MTCSHHVPLALSADSPYGETRACVIDVRRMLDVFVGSMVGSANRRMQSGGGNASWAGTLDKKADRRMRATGTFQGAPSRRRTLFAGLPTTDRPRGI